MLPHRYCDQIRATALWVLRHHHPSAHSAARVVSRTVGSTVSHDLVPISCGSFRCASTSRNFKVGLLTRILRARKKVKHEEQDEKQQLEKLESAERLPSIPWIAQDEFPKNHSWGYFRSHMQAQRRLAVMSSREFLVAQTVIVFLGSLAAVLGIGMYEAALQCVNPLQDFYYVLWYAIHNVIPSMVWESQEFAHVILARGGDPKVILKVLDEALNSENASTLIRVQDLKAARSILASFMALAQVLRIVTVGFDSSDKYRRRILNGTEPPINGQIKEKVIRLAGRESIATRLAMERYDGHVLPVYEDPNVIEDVIRRYWNDGKIPVVWRVSRKNYGQMASWTDLKIDDSWFLSTEKGEKVLYIEADSTNAEEALAIGHESTNLSLSEASRAFIAIEMAARANNAKFDRVMRVFLADSLQEIGSGGGYMFTLKEQVEGLKEVDVLIDAKFPLLEQLLDWCEKILLVPQPSFARKPNPPQTIVFHTSSEEHFTVVKELLAGFNINVIDRAEKDSFDPFTCPRLVYERTTDETVACVNALLAKGLVDPSRCCVILERKEGIVELAELSYRYSNAVEIIPSSDGSESKPQMKLHTICSAEIYDDLFRQVRIWTRMGFSPEQIQTELDIRANKYFEVAPSVNETVHALFDEK